MGMNQDLRVLEWLHYMELAEQFATAGKLGKVDGITPFRARGVLERLYDEDFVAKHSQVYRTGVISVGYVLTTRGRNAVRVYQTAHQMELPF